MTTPPDLPLRVRQAAQAVSTLAVALATPSANALERDGTIQRFEYSLEAVLKVLAKVLAFENPGFDSRGSRDTVRQAILAGYVTDDAIWLAMWKARNQTVHGYIPEVAEAIAAELPAFLSELQHVVGQLQARYPE